MGKHSNINWLTRKYIENNYTADDVFNASMIYAALDIMGKKNRELVDGALDRMVIQEIIRKLPEKILINSRYSRWRTQYQLRETKTENRQNKESGRDNLRIDFLNALNSKKTSDSDIEKIFYPLARLVWNGNILKELTSVQLAIMILGNNNTGQAHLILDFVNDYIDERVSYNQAKLLPEATRYKEFKILAPHINVDRAKLKISQLTDMDMCDKRIKSNVKVMCRIMANKLIGETISARKMAEKIGASDSQKDRNSVSAFMATQVTKGRFKNMGKQLDGLIGYLIQKPVPAATNNNVRKIHTKNPPHKDGKPVSKDVWKYRNIVYYFAIKLKTGDTFNEKDLMKSYGKSYVAAVIKRQLAHETIEKISEFGDYKKISDIYIAPYIKQEVERGGENKNAVSKKSRKIKITGTGKEAEEFNVSNNEGERLQMNSAAYSKFKDMAEQINKLKTANENLLLANAGLINELRAANDYLILAEKKLKGDKALMSFTNFKEFEKSIGLKP